MTTEFALEQLERKSLTFAHTKSVLTFIKQVKLTRELTLPVSTGVDSAVKNTQQYRIVYQRKDTRRSIPTFRALGWEGPSSETYFCLYR